MMARVCSECGRHAVSVVYGRPRWFRGRPRRRVCDNPRCVQRGQLRLLGIDVPKGAHR